MRSLGAVAIIIAVMAVAQPARSAQLIGRVNDYQGTPITNVKVAILAPGGKQVTSVLTDKNGTFDATNLPPGDYDLELHPLTGGLLGGSLELHLSPTGATVNWTIVPPYPYLV